MPTDKNIIIRSSKISTKFSNNCKVDNITLFNKEYKNALKQFIDIFWDMDKIPKLIDKGTSSQINTWLSARMVQCAGKQASGIVRGTKQKNKQRLHVYKKLLKEGDTKNAEKLKKVIDKNPIGKPILDHVNPELDSRFIKIDTENETSFDGWITIASIGNKEKIKIPFKSHKHLNEMIQKGKMKSGIRLNKNYICLMFEVEKKENKKKEVLGIDIGQRKVISASNGFQSEKNNHGHDLETIISALSRREKGSKGFRKAQAHRTNYINWTINRLNLEDFKELKLENIEDLRKGKNVSRNFSHWTYAEIYCKLEQRCEELDVQVIYNSPVYTSKRCSECGWTHKNNRRKELFKCVKCGNVMDADLNASINIKDISEVFEEICYNQRHNHNISEGFFWNKDYGQDSIVPVSKKNKKVKIRS